MTGKHHYVLYVTGRSIDSARLESVVRAALVQAFDGELELEIVDVLQTPERAVTADVFVTPTLQRRWPGPDLRLVGNVDDLSALMPPPLPEPGDA